MIGKTNVIKLNVSFSCQMLMRTLYECMNVCVCVCVWVYMYVYTWHCMCRRTSQTALAQLTYGVIWLTFAVLHMWYIWQLILSKLHFVSLFLPKSRIPLFATFRQQCVHTHDDPSYVHHTVRATQWHRAVSSRARWICHLGLRWTSARTRILHGWGKIALAC